jgi:hypothetical protein
MSRLLHDPPFRTRLLHSRGKAKLKAGADNSSSDGGWRVPLTYFPTFELVELSATVESPATTTQAKRNSSSPRYALPTLFGPLKLL